MGHMTEMEMAGWLQHYLPTIPPGAGEGTPCWIGRMKMRRAEHNPPFYWLGRALDVVDAHGAGETIGARLEAAHGPDACNGDERDERVQRVLSEACAFAWTATHIGAPRIEVAGPGTSIAQRIAQDRIRLRVADHDTYVLPARLRPASTGGEVLEDVVEETIAAADLLPPARGRLLYLDMFYGRQYPSNVGYDLGLTEPVQAMLRHACDEAHLGHVFTRPFQWGNPVAASY